MSRRARFTELEIARIFKAAVKAGVNVHLRVEPDSTLDVKTTGAMSKVAEDQDTPENLVELVRHAR